MQLEKSFYQFFRDEALNFVTVSMMIYVLTLAYHNSYKIMRQNPYFDIRAFLVGVLILGFIAVSIHIWGSWNRYRNPDLASKDTNGGIEVELMSFIYLMSISTYIIYWLCYQPGLR